MKVVSENKAKDKVRNFIGDFIIGDVFCAFGFIIDVIIEVQYKMKKLYIFLFVIAKIM